MGAKEEKGKFICIIQRKAVPLLPKPKMGLRVGHTPNRYPTDQAKVHPPSIEVSHSFYIKAFIGACFGPLKSAIFTTQSKNGNERLQDMISPFVRDEDYHIRRGRLDCLFL
ncbi:MAG: hypothetical protein ACI3Z8_05875 [Paludibacteraceae bacterium]